MVSRSQPSLISLGNIIFLKLSVENVAKAKDFEGLLSTWFFRPVEYTWRNKCTTDWNLCFPFAVLQRDSLNAVVKELHELLLHLKYKARQKHLNESSGNQITVELNQNKINK